ncbi:MAG: LCP family protein [Candidatus Nanopelagicales bacterium]
MTPRHARAEPEPDPPPADALIADPDAGGNAAATQPQASGIAADSTLGAHARDIPSAPLPLSTTRGPTPGAQAGSPDVPAAGRNPAPFLFAGVVLLLIVAMLVWGSSGGGSGASPTPSPTPSPGVSGFDVQQTMLVQVRNDSEVGAGNAVLGVGGDLPPAQLLAPSRLIVDVPGAGQQTLGQSARQLDRTSSQGALSDLLALRIDGTLSLGRLALSGLVDYVGGITLNVTQAITEERDGKDVLVVPAGTVLLNGSQAAAYALAWLPDEPEAARLARYSEVLTETISGLPDDQLRIEAILTSLGGSARTTTSTTSVAAFLKQARREIRADGQRISVLPTSDAEVTGTLQRVRVDLAGAQKAVKKLLPEARLTSAEARPRVLVYNGIGAPGLGAVARGRLVAAGMVYINGGNAQDLRHPQTSILISADSTEADSLGGRIASALQVPASAVAVAEPDRIVADSVVVLGQDFPR